MKKLVFTPNTKPSYDGINPYVIDEMCYYPQAKSCEWNNITINNSKINKMKNLWLLPTDKLSKLHVYDSLSPISLSRELLKWRLSHHIYITSNEGISGFENGIWVLSNGRVWLWESTMALKIDDKPKKIILTTDQDLIADGVQGVNDEFLQWFVKNPKCNHVEVKHVVKDYVDEQDAYGYDVDYHKISLPKEGIESHSFCETSEERCTSDENGCQNRKRELVELDLIEKPLDEVATDYNNLMFKNSDNQLYFTDKTKPFIAGAEWQKERSYSEQDMLLFMQFIVSEEELENTSSVSLDTAKYYLNKFKNKSND